VAKQHWVDGNFTTHATSGVVPNIPPIVENGKRDKTENGTGTLI